MSNIADSLRMWRKALAGTVPRLEVTQWRALDPVARFLIAIRSQVMIMTLLSAGIGGILVARAGMFSLRLWGLVTAGLLLAHASNNLINDFTDYVRGVDKDNYARAQYGPHPLAHGLISLKAMVFYIVLCAIPALAIGVYLGCLRGTPAWILFGLGSVFVLFYTWPLKYIGLGEVAVLVVWGPLMIGGSYLILTGVWDPQVSLIALPYALGATSVLFGKHIDKCETDRKKGIRTLPVLLGEYPARMCVIAMMLAQYAVVFWLVITRVLSPVLLVVVVALRTFFQVVQVLRAPRPKERPDFFPLGVWPLWYVAFAFLHNRNFGLLFLLGLVADLISHRMGWF